jgi:hypothetical protein
MVLNLFVKQLNKIARKWTRQMAMTSIRSKENTPPVRFMHNSKEAAALQHDKRFRIQPKTKLATNQRI